MYSCDKAKTVKGSMFIEPSLAGTKGFSLVKYGTALFLLNCSLAIEPPQLVVNISTKIINNLVFVSISLLLRNLKRSKVRVSIVLFLTPSVSHLLGLHQDYVRRELSEERLGGVVFASGRNPDGEGPGEGSLA